MAKSPQLVAAVAKIVGKPEKTVSIALRRLQEAGLIEVTGKGRGGKHMTSRDAAMLLLAMSTGTMLKDSPAAIPDYWNLPLVPTDPHRFDLLGHPPADRPFLTRRYFNRMFTKAITPVDTLGSVVTNIIERAVAGTLFPKPERADLLNPSPDTPTPDQVSNSELNLRIYAPWRAASIRVRMNLQWKSDMLFMAQAAPGDDPFPGEDRLRSAAYAEIRQFSEAAILAIGDCLR